MRWREERIANVEGVPSAVCVAEVAGSRVEEGGEECGRKKKWRRTVVIYF